jgi:sugar transferase (PEP-CTERM/EpsH1 system associated)
MPIRIMHIVDSLGKGGLENGLVNLIQRLDPSRFEHTVCAIRKLGANAERLPADCVRVTCLGKKATNSRLQVPALARGIREFKPHIVHSRNWGAVEGVVAGRWVGSCAVVHSEHGLESDTSSSEPLRRRCLRRLAFEMADLVLSVSNQLRDFHSRRTGFPMHKIRVIHNGVDSSLFFPNPAARAQVRRELGLAEDEFCIGCVGNLLPVKDHLTLLEAISAADDTCKRWRLLIIGEGPERPKLEAFVNAHPNWNKNVCFLGSSQRVSELLNAMDVYVLSSVMEGISNSLLEAMATGLPVIATDVGGNPEVVVDQESGLLFPSRNFLLLAQHLVALRLRKEHRVQLGRQAMRRVQKEFSIDSMVQKYEQLYENLMAGAAAPLRAVAGTW